MESYLQMRVGDHSYNGDDMQWGYLPATHYMNLRPGYKANADWDAICRSMGFHHMLTIKLEVARDVSIDLQEIGRYKK